MKWNIIKLFKLFMFRLSITDLKNYLNMDLKKINLDFKERKEILIYRYEKNGIGPYRQVEFNPLEKEILDKEDSDKNPLPINDFESHILFISANKIMSDFYFGFKSLEQLNNWFDKEDKKTLIDNNYELIKYSVSIYIESEKQVMFDMDFAIRIEE